MPVPVGPNMGGPSTTDKCKFEEEHQTHVYTHLLTIYTVKMGAMMGGSKNTIQRILLHLG